MKITTTTKFNTTTAHRLAVRTLKREYTDSESHEIDEVDNNIEIDESETLVVYENESRTPMQVLAIFVHGLGGNRLDTWQKFPEFLQDDLDHLDVGMYQYATASSRFLRTTPDVRNQAQTLAHVIRAESKYKRIILVGHSLGGILNLGAIEYLLRTEPKVIDRIKALFLMATPQLGSTSVPWITRLFSKDARALYPHNGYLNDIHEAFANHINPFADRSMIKDNTNVRQLPIFVVTADRDAVVDKLSAGAWIPATQKNHTRGTHTSIVKPEHKGADAYQWVKRKIATLFPDWERD